MARWPKKGTAAYKEWCANIWPKKGTKAYAERVAKVRTHQLHKGWKRKLAYLKRHDPKAYNEWRAKLSEANKKAREDPTVRKRLSRQAKRRQTPELIARRTRKMKRTKNDPLYKARVSAQQKAIWTDPDLKARHSAALKKAWQNKRRHRLHAEARIRQSGVESGLESRIRDALNQPHRDVLKFGRAWDMAFPRFKTFVEIQGCHVHYCSLCQRPGTENRKTTDARKRKVAMQHGWRVVYLFSHEESSFMANPKRWFDRKVRGLA